MQILIPLSDKFWTSRFDDGLIWEDKDTMLKNSNLLSHFFENY